MKIKKVSGTAVLKGNVVNNLTDNSTENAPSQRAVNEALLDKYSTEEVKTNKVWIDGKPIYRKLLIYNDSTGLTNNQEILHGVSNIGEYKQIVSQQYIINDLSYHNVYESSTNFINVINISTTSITFIVGSAWNKVFKKAYIIIEYTKTTD